MDIARSLGMMTGIVDGLDYLCSLDLHRQALTYEEFDPLICEAVVQSNRFISGERQLGMWEQLWRDRHSDQERQEK